MAQISAFTQNELILLTKTHADIQLYAHEIENDEAHGWELRIQYEDKPHKRHQTMTLATEIYTTRDTLSLHDALPIWCRLWGLSSY